MSYPLQAQRIGCCGLCARRGNFLGHQAMSSYALKYQQDSQDVDFSVEKYRRLFLRLLNQYFSPKRLIVAFH